MNWENILYFFISYAVWHWGKHFSYSGQQSSRLLDEYPQFFSSESRILKDWSFLMPLRTRFNGMASIAALFGLPDILQQCLKEGGIRLYLKDLFTGRKGHTLIHLASVSGHLPTIEILIKNKVRINSKDKDGNTPLYYAAERGHLAVVKTLLTNGARVDRGHEGRTPLFAAMQYNRHEIADHLLRSGAKSNDTTLEASPLGAAIMSGNVELVRLLMRKICLHCRNPSDLSILGKALYVNSRLLFFFLMLWAKMFCDKPSRFRKQVYFGNTTALHIACRDGILPAIRLLLDPKWSLDMNIRDENRDTALYLAVEYRNAEAVELLLAQTARVDPRLVNDLGLGPIHAALIRPRIAIIRRLLEESNVSLPKPTKNCRWSPIHLLTISSNELVRVRRERWKPHEKWHHLWPECNGDECNCDEEERVKEALQFLVEEVGVDPQLRTPKTKRIHATWHSHHFISLDGRTKPHWSKKHIRGEPFNLSPWLSPPDFCYETPLSLAIRGGYVSTVEYFLEHCQIDPNAPCRGCDGASPLHVAAQSLRDDVVDILISKWKTDIHCVDDYQRTPLHSVAGALSPTELDFDSFRARDRIIYALFKAGAKTSATDINGHTPRDLFVSNRHFNPSRGKEDKKCEFDGVLRGEFRNYNEQSLYTGRHNPNSFRGHVAEFIIDHTFCPKRYIKYPPTLSGIFNSYTP